MRATNFALTGKRNQLTIAVLLAALCSAGVEASDSERQCHQLYRLTDVSHAIEPGIPVAASDEQPAHCKVRGVVNRAIRFEVRLPMAGWNGRLMFTAVGGAAGVIGDTTSLLADGFAMASTDTGHEISEGFEFYRQPEAAIDYAYRGVHLATLASKRVISEFYGRAIDHAYLTGCSNGGRAALMEAIRFPDDYDGIIAGAPAFRFQEFASWMIAMHRLQSAHPLTDDSLLLLDNASRQACDGIDGVVDGVIDDPRLCTVDALDLGALACADEQDEGCLTKGQIATARAHYQDLTNAAGDVVSPGVPPGAEAAGDWAFWMQPHAQFGEESPIGSMDDLVALLMRFETDFNVEDYDPAEDRDRIAEVTTPLDVRTGDLSEFRDRGGKLLMYQGWNDYPLRPQRAIDYLGKVEQAMGGPEATGGFLRLFMVPGMTHCAGGPGPWQVDYVKPLVAWREEGKAPERIIGTQPGPVEFDHLAPDARAVQPHRFTRPLCPYPEYAKYRGQGDQNDERNFDCVSP